MQLPLGFYKWSFEGGEFAVGILPNNVFYCSSYPVHGGVWNILPNAKNSVDAMNTTSSLVIDWKRYGVYEFPITSDDHGRIGPTHIHGRDLVLCGQCRGEQSNTSWRKMQFVREFTPLEKKLMGHGFGSVWDFSWSKGCFEVKFHFDSFHHFVCDLCPEHSHWDLSDNDAETGAVITIHWGRYGVYELREDPASGHLYGHAKGQPTNWRKASYKRLLRVDEVEHECSHHAHHQAT